MSTSSDQTNFLRNAINNRLLTILVSKQSDIQQNINSISLIDLNCNTSKDSPCTTCINLFGTESDACETWCNCSLTNTILNSNLNADLSSAIDSITETDIDNLTTEVVNDYGEKYTETKNNDINKANITAAINRVVDILKTSVKEKTIQQINQKVGSYQNLSVNSAGSNINNVNMKSFISAIFSAVNDATVTFNLNDFVSDQMTQIRKEVDKITKNALSKIWQNVKGYVIGLGCFILFLILSLIFLLFKKAALDK